MSGQWDLWRFSRTSAFDVIPLSQRNGDRKRKTSWEVDNPVHHSSSCNLAKVDSLVRDEKHETNHSSNQVRDSLLA